MDAGWRVIVRYDLPTGPAADRVRARLGDLAPLCWWAVLPRAHPDWAAAADWARQLRAFGVEAEPAPAARAAAVAAELGGREPPALPPGDVRAAVARAHAAGEGGPVGLARRFGLTKGQVKHILRQARKAGTGAAVSSGESPPPEAPA